MFKNHPNINPLIRKYHHKSLIEIFAESISFAQSKDSKHKYIAMTIPSNICKLSGFHYHIQHISSVSQQFDGLSTKISYIESSNIVIIDESSHSLPLSYYLSVHSFMGDSWQMVRYASSILYQILVILSSMHQNRIICRVLTPSNIFLDSNANKVTIGSVLDSQGVGGPFVKMPDDFSHPSNPYLPPEYYHQKPESYTSAFDIWQFGILLLYMITGQLPPSYGKEYLLHTEHSQRNTRTEKSNSSILQRPKEYPRIVFFYDWIKTISVVSPNDKHIGERGESFFVTESSKLSASLLSIESLRLLPSLNSKLSIDDSFQIIEIISLCLQIDPSKRPTADQLLRHPVFSQSNHLYDVFRSYTRTPNPKVFVSQFFLPFINSPPL